MLVYVCLPQEAIPEGARIVLLPESSLSEIGLDSLGRALGQHPRMLFFAVNHSLDPDAKLLQSEKATRRLHGKPSNLTRFADT